MNRSAHDDAAATALDALYELQGIDATYTPAGGSGSTVQVLVNDRTQSTQDKTGARSRSHVLRGLLRVSQVAEIGRGDTLQLAGETLVFKILPSSVSNDGLEWDFEANAEVTKTVGNVNAIPDR
ncbi:hypothetical protein EKK58_12330 [Candidatus Dependentiae bacterium]|nr:MAG: hypothetical protein EKK58_12330 [Candidatus Dependentiae bacterium]